MAMLRWLDRVGVAGAEDLAQRFDISLPVVWRRMRVLRGAGLVGYCRALHGRPGAFTAPGARVATATWTHTLGVVRLVVAYELAGWRVVTERELRAPELDRSVGWVVDLGTDRAGRRRVHFPDLVVVDPGTDEAVAVELELSGKGRRRLEGILAGYARGGVRVRYLVSHGQIGQAVSEAAGRVGAGRLVDVEELSW